MDQNTIGEMLPQLKSKSVLNTEEGRMHAEHGHALDDERCANMRSFLSDRGWSHDDIDGFFDRFDMRPSRQHIEGEEVEEDAGEETEHQRNLESSRNKSLSGTNFNRRDESEARRTEHRDSTQSEDNLRASRVHRGRGGRWAHDADWVAMRQEAQRIEPFYGKRWQKSQSVTKAERHKVAASLALDGERRDKFAERYGQHAANITVAY
jgi:hypothetical protein